MRHVKAKHNGTKVVSSLLCDIICGLSLPRTDSDNNQIAESADTEIRGEVQSPAEGSAPQNIYNGVPLQEIGPSGDSNSNTIEDLGRFGCQPCGKEFK